jgi:phage-related minor tail protein
MKMNKNDPQLIFEAYNQRILQEAWFDNLMQWFGKKKEEFTKGKRGAYSTHGNDVDWPEPTRTLDSDRRRIEAEEKLRQAEETLADAQRYLNVSDDGTGGTQGDQLRDLEQDVIDLQQDVQDWAQFANQQQAQHADELGRTRDDARDAIGQRDDEILRQSGEIGDYARQVETLEQSITTKKAEHDNHMATADAARQQAETLQSAAEQGQQEAIEQVANLKQQQADAQAAATKAMEDATAQISDLGNILSTTQDDMTQLNGSLEQLNIQIDTERQQAKQAAQEAEMWIQYYQDNAAQADQQAAQASTPNQGAWAPADRLPSAQTEPRESVQSDCLKFNQGHQRAGHVLAGILAGKTFSGKQWFSIN